MCPMMTTYSYDKNASDEKDRHIQRSAAARKPAVRQPHPLEIIQRVRMNPASLTYNDVIQLQGTIGNKAVHKLLSEVYGSKKPQAEGKPVQMKVRDGEKTGMQQNLRAGLEALSGHDLSDVNVHRNSGKPQQVGALAYTQGNNIYVAPGQEKHIPHEGWHVVQQKEGRVQPTLQMKTGVLVNDDETLEKEADIMGKKAAEGGKAVQLQKDSMTQFKQDEGKVMQLASANPLSILSTELKALDLPIAVRYTFMAMGGGLAAAGTDGPLPIGDIIAAIVAIGGAVVLACYWDEISPKWNEIVNAFKNAFSSMASNITKAFTDIALKVEIAYVTLKIPKKLKSGDKVDISKFNQKKPGNGSPTWIGPLGWLIQKDMAGHGGRVWKLFNKAGERIASLAADGKILGK